jgi:hypothetical protein
MVPAEGICFMDLEKLLKEHRDMQSFRFSLLLVVSLSAGVFSVVGGQKPGAAASSADPPKWETLRPEGEEFTVLMPKGSTFETSKEPYHKMELNTRFYLSQTQNGPVFAVVSLSGIKSNPAMYTEMQRVNSYVDAFKKLFTPKIRGKAAIAKLTLVRERLLHGNPGREYRMTVGDLSGDVHAFATRRRFYAVVYLNSKKDEALQEEFLSSFVLPEKLATPPPAVAQGQVLNPSHPPTQPSEPAPGSVSASDSAGTPNDPKSAQATPAGAEPGAKAPIRAGVLNGKAISLPKPQHPSEARDVSGAVSVEVTIDEMGNVVAAKAVSGPQPLHQAAVNAALQAKFSSTFLMGESVKVAGIITYNFVKR